MPVRLVVIRAGKLAKDPIAIGFVSYEHSSASFYEDGIARHFIPKHYKDL
ncbi:MAG: hypothetical protein M3Z92_14425 [Bacteroidota bacterium]|nr:hypothetical protein [Bacteroidota bacterium]